jgi:hypothetical protein
MKDSKFLAVTIEAHRVISEEHLAEAFDQIIWRKHLIKLYVCKEGQRLWLCAGLTYVFTSLQDCDDSGYITVDNLVSILGSMSPRVI